MEGFAAIPGFAAAKGNEGEARIGGNEALGAGAGAIEECDPPEAGVAQSLPGIGLVRIGERGRLGQPPGIGPAVGRRPVLKGIAAAILKIVIFLVGW